MYDLSFQMERERLAATIAAEVEKQSIEAFSDGPRRHLGASLIGHECERYLWNSFRWLKQEAFSGRMYRLFNRGHLEEARFIDRLKAIGFEIFDQDSEGNQFRISGCKGHYGGSLDSVAVAPERFGINSPLLTEYKTHGETSFTKLAGKIVTKTPNIVRTKGEGLRKSKPQHYSQMCAYGQAYGIHYGLYCAVNKNTDELYFEIVELDWNQGVNLYAKAERVIFSQTPPPKIAQSIAFFTCKYCAFGPICHAAGNVEKNCRSCEHAFPVDGGEWRCRIADAIIPADVIAKGCESWRRIA